MSTPDPTQPTQVQHPVKAALRTFIQASSATMLILLALSEMLQTLSEDLAGALPEAWVAWLAGAASTTGLLAGVFARIMAGQRVNALLTRLGLGAVPK